MNRRGFLLRSAHAGSVALAALADVRLRLSEEQARLDDLPDAKAYSLGEGVTYFNHGSIGTVPRLVQRAHAEYLRICEENPWLYIWGGAWDEAARDTRERAARFLGCSPGEVVINRSTTDGFNLLASGLELGAGDEVLFSNFNHDGASVCWQHHRARLGYSVRRVDLPFEAFRDITEDELVQRHVEAIGEPTRVLVIPHVDNLLGVRTPVARVAAAARARGVEFVFVDGAQSAGMFPFRVDTLGVDAFCTSPHKWLQAPKGIGTMYLARSFQEKLEPQTVTWGQRKWQGDVRRFEDYGTRDLPAILALGDAIGFQESAGIEASWERRLELRAHVLERVGELAGLAWRSPLRPELASSLYAIEPVGQTSSEVRERLWQEHGVVTRSFSNLNTLRFSINTANTEAELDAALERMAGAG